MTRFLSDCCVCDVEYDESLKITRIHSLCKFHNNLKTGQSADPIFQRCRDAKTESGFNQNTATKTQWDSYIDYKSQKKQESK